MEMICDTETVHNQVQKTCVTDHIWGDLMQRFDKWSEKEEFGNREAFASKKGLKVGTPGGRGNHKSSERPEGTRGSLCFMHKGLRPNNFHSAG